jgi:predicted NodU family carbamoyl transferase
LAPALPSNALNCRLNSTIYRQVTTTGTHFAPISGTGGAVGAAMRTQIDRLLL